MAAYSQNAGGYKPILLHALSALSIYTFLVNIVSFSLAP